MGKYKLWIPIYNRKLTEENRARLLNEIKRAKTDLALITFGRILRDREMLKNETEMFLENAELFRKEGINVGAWLVPTIGYGSDFYGDNSAKYDFTHIKKAFG